MAKKYKTEEKKLSTDFLRPKSPVSSMTEKKTFQTASQSHSFDLISFLQYQEPIAGLIFHEESIALALYRSARHGDIHLVAEEHQDIPPQAITESVLHDQDTLTDVLRTLFEKAHVKNPSVILSLPPQESWMSMLEFPGHLAQNDLEEAVNLHLEFSLPFSRQQSYVDWEQVSKGDLNKSTHVLVGAMPKIVVDPYREILARTKTTAVAIETHLMSVERAIRGQVRGIAAYTLLYPSGAHIGVYHDTIFRFQRFIPWQSALQKDSHHLLVKELETIRSFLRAEPHDACDIEHVIILGPLDAVQSFLPFAHHAMQGITFSEASAFGSSLTSIIAQGAAYRGVLARREDSFLSFAAVGTETIYEKTRALSFSDFFKKLSIGISFFFLLVYAGSYLLLAQISRRIDAQQALEAPKALNLIAIQESAKQFNKEVKTLALFAKKNPQWAHALEAVLRLINSGITVHAIEIENIAQGIALSGVAKNKDSLIQLKNAISSSGMFAAVDIPFSLLIAKGDIPFRFELLLIHKQQFSSP